MEQIQKTAIKETVKTVAGLTVIGLAVPAAIFLIPLEVVGSIAGVFAMGVAVKMIYDTKLAQAKFDAEFKKTVDQ